MTAIVENVQKTGVESGVITLYKLEYADNTFAYFVAGVEEDLSSIQFRDEDGTIRTYTPIPIELEGFDISSDGAISRPKMTVANIESTFRDSLGGLGFEDLIGRRITRRTTQQKYLVGESGDSTPPVEFPKITYVIDRLASKTVMGVTFELAAPFDLAGIKLPQRVIIGGACPWKYQGASTTLGEAVKEGGCHWRADNKITIDGVERTLFMTENDEYVIPTTAGFTAASGQSSFTQNNYYITYTTEQRIEPDGSFVSESNVPNYWHCQTATTSQPSATNAAWKRVRVYDLTYAQQTTYKGYVNRAHNQYILKSGKLWQVKRVTQTANFHATVEEGQSWTAGDKCGKKLTSCAMRFQAKVHPSYNTRFSVLKDNTKPLPFGGFPGVVQRRG